MEMITVKAADYGLEEKKASQISDMFKPMLDQMVGLEKEYNEVTKLEINEETCAIAKELRLRYVKARTGTAAIHKDLKQFYLQGGRFVDGWKNAQLMAGQGVEEKLQDIENHFVNIEKEKAEKLEQARYDELSKYIEDDSTMPVSLGSLSEDVWNNYIAGAKKNYEDRIAAEKKAEADRIVKEKAEADERARVAKENEDLKKAAEATEKKRIEDEAAREKVEQDRVAKESADAKIREEKERQDREAHQAQLNKEREEKEKAEAELKTKQDAEIQAKKDEEQRVQAELKKGDADKVNDLVNDLIALKGKYEFKSEKNRTKYKGVSELIDKVVDYIEKEN